MKKPVCFFLMTLAVLALAIGGCSKKPLVIKAPDPTIINFPEATVEVLQGIKLQEAGAYLNGETVFIDRSDYYLTFLSDDTVIYERYDSLKGEKSRRIEVMLTQGVISLEPMSRPRQIVGSAEFTAIVTGFEHRIKMMEATRHMLYVLVENTVAIEEGYVMPREDICNEGTRTTDERYEPSPISVIFIVSRTAERMTDSFLNDGTPYLEFGKMLEADRILKDYLQAQHGCLQLGNAFESLEKGQNLIEEVLAN